MSESLWSFQSFSGSDGEQCNRMDANRKSILSGIKNCAASVRQWSHSRSSLRRPLAMAASWKVASTTWLCVLKASKLWGPFSVRRRSLRQYLSISVGYTMWSLPMVGLWPWYDQGTLASVLDLSFQDLFLLCQVKC